MNIESGLLPVVLAILLKALFKTEGASLCGYENILMFVFQHRLWQAVHGATVGHKFDCTIQCSCNLAKNVKTREIVSEIGITCKN